MLGSPTNGEAPPAHRITSALGYGVRQTNRYVVRATTNGPGRTRTCDLRIMSPLRAVSLIWDLSRVCPESFRAWRVSNRIAVHRVALPDGHGTDIRKSLVATTAVQCLGSASVVNVLLWVRNTRINEGPLVSIVRIVSCPPQPGRPKPRTHYLSHHEVCVCVLVRRLSYHDRYQLTGSRKRSSRNWLYRCISSRWSIPTFAATSDIFLASRFS